MAELDPEKVGRSGVDPVTGSPLSQEVRTALLKKSTIDASVFQNIENRRAQSDAQNAELSRGQEQALLGFNSTLQAIRTDIVKLGTGLSGIALLLQQDATEDRNKVRVDQEKERVLSERQIRIGKENEIEQKIQNAVAEPVQKLVPQVNDIFGRIGAALGILFGGWLTKQTVDAIKASEEGNTKLFNEIRFNILKNVGIAVGGLIAVKVGFSLITRTIAGIASGLTKLLIAKPLALAAGLISLPGRGPKTTGPKTTGPKSGGGVLSGLGRLLTGLSVAMNYKNKEYTDSVLGALSLFAKAPGPIGLIAKVAGVTFTLDEIAEAFGKNIFGDDRDNIVNSAAAAAKKELEKLKKPTPTKPASSPTPPPGAPISSLKPAPSPTPPAPPIAQPQTSMMGEQPSTPAPSQDMEKKFEQAWQYRNNSMARGRIEDAWKKMTPDQQQQAKTWAQTKGYDWNEMKLKDAVDMSDLKQQPSKTEEAKITSAQVTMPPKEPQQVGQLPEPKPSLTMIKTSSAQQQQPNPPLTNGALTDVPLINSANPDNFYVLYSQLNYNVVM
jgi:hypothetical protein